MQFWFSSYWCLKVMKVLESQKMSFFNFSGTEVVSNNFFHTLGPGCCEKYCIASNRFWFFKIQSFAQKQKCLISVLLDWNLKKNYCHISNQHTQICKNVKVYANQKDFLFGTKIASFRYISDTILKNLHQDLRIFHNTKLCGKIKIQKFEAKKIFFGNF